MIPKYHLNLTDVIVLIVSLFVPLLIGIFFRFSGNRQRTIGEFFLADKDASKFSVVMSASVTVMSAILLIGSPAEIYRYGPLCCLLGLSNIPGQFVASKIFLPVYFQCEVSSIYEFLEIRYGKLTRYFVAFMFILQMMLYGSAVLYGPSLALSAVTDISLELSIILCGTICTAYCFMGGMKAVLYTDVFQSLLMFLGLLTLYTTGITEVGLGEIYRRALSGGRLNFYSVQFDFITRYTLWNIFFRGFCDGMGLYGTNQLQVQRLLCTGECKKAQSCLQWSTIPITLWLFFGSFFGVVLYAVFYTCDPVFNKEETGLMKYDMMIPYYIVTRLHSYPGLTGICFAGIFSGSLSTISSALNSMSAVTVIDFVQPLFSAKKITSKRVVFIAKAMSLSYGIVFILLAFAISKVQSILQAGMSFLALSGGPISAIFLIGVLTRKGSDRGILFSLVLGCCFTLWVGIGSMSTGYRSPPLPIGTAGCSNATKISQNATQCINTTCPTMISETFSMSEIFFLYKISHNWLPALSCLFTLCVIFVTTVFTGLKNNTISADSKCLTPVSRFWIKSGTSQQRDSCQMCVATEQEKLV